MNVKNCNNRAKRFDAKNTSRIWFVCFSQTHPFHYLFLSPLSHSAFDCFECLFFASRVSSADKINCQCLSQCQKLYWEHNICYWTYTMCMLDFFFVQLCLQNWLHMFGQCSTIHNSYSFGSGSAWERYVSWFLKVLSMSVWRIFRDKTLPKNSIHIFFLLSF